MASPGKPKVQYGKWAATLFVDASMIGAACFFELVHPFPRGLAAGVALAIVILGGKGTYGLIDLLSRRRARGAPYGARVCAGCGYPLRGVRGGRCPECGREH